MINGLDLFSGIGGFALALKEWVKPLAYCEIDRYCQSVLLSRISDKSLHQAPIWDDIRTFEADFFERGCIDIITAGFPCQDISIAGLRKGLEGERSGLFFEIVRLAKEIKPKFIFLENVPGITSKGGLRVVREVAEMGYDSRWCVISASSLGAPHKRERWFFLAYSNADRNRFNGSSILTDTKMGISNAQKGQKSASLSEGMDRSGNVARKVATNPESQRMQSSRDTGRIEKGQSKSLVPNFPSYWEETKPPFCGVDDAVPNRVHRIRALGNAVVPGQAKKAFKILMGLI